MQTVMVKGRVYNYDYTIGRNGEAGTGFRYPIDLALGADRRLYVLNRGDEYTNSQRVTVLTMDEEFITDIGCIGEDKGQFVWPSSLVIDSQGNVYVADEWLNRINIFDKDGKSLGHWGKPGDKPGQLQGPSGLAFDAQDNLYVTEEQTHRVQVFTGDGKPLRHWGSQGVGEGQFNRPWGITVDTKGDVYVADWKNHRVQKFDAEGKPLAAIGSHGDGPGLLNHPTDVAVDKDGDIYVVDWWNSKLEVFDSQGQPLTTFVGNSERLSRWAQVIVNASPDIQKARMRVRSLEPEYRFYRPQAVAVDDQGHVVVADTLRCRIQVYKKESDWPSVQFNL
jgi:DNA-binding beta-propeller fold protein YncE